LRVFLCDDPFTVLSSAVCLSGNKGADSGATAVSTGESVSQIGALFVCARGDLPVVSNYREGSSVKRMLGVLLTMSAICSAQATGPMNGLATLDPGVTSQRASS